MTTHIIGQNEEITHDDLCLLRSRLLPLIGVQFELLRIPKSVLAGFEPSQIGTIVGTLMDACIPQLNEILPDDTSLVEVGLIKHKGILGDREGYPDFEHASGARLELKLLYVDPVDVIMKKPSTPREPSARLAQKVTRKNVRPPSDALLVIAYQLRPNIDDASQYSPTIIDFDVFSMIECIRARDRRLIESGGRWFGNYDTPVVLSKIGRAKLNLGIELDDSTYGRKEEEGKDYNEDTNFGKMKRIPYPPLQAYLAKYRSIKLR